MLLLLLLALGWAPKNTNVHVKDLGALPVRPSASHFQKLGGTVTITLPRIYVHAPHSGDVSKVTPVPSEACENGLCSLSFHAETLALPTFSVRTAALPAPGSSNLGRGEWKCAEGRCAVEFRKVSGCCAVTEVAVAREVAPGKALFCSGSLDVPRSGDDASVVGWILRVCDGVTFAADAATKKH